MSVETTTSLTDLISRLILAPKPQRELDRAIADALDLTRGPHGPADDGPDICARFTASLDEAVRIIPADHDWSLHIDNGEAIAGCMPASKDGCDVADCRGAAPAIALCIAALKARKKHEERSG